MISSEPLFLKNKDWYTTPEDEGLDDMFFEDGRGYHIKDDAPEEVKNSYEEFYNPTPLVDECGESLLREGMKMV